MAKEWTMVRIQKKTWEGLSALRMAMEDAQANSRAEYRSNRDGLVSLDAVVEMLLNHFWRKRERSGSRAKAAALEMLAAWRGEQLSPEGEEEDC